MKIDACVAGFSIIGLLGGCSGAASGSDSMPAAKATEGAAEQSPAATSASDAVAKDTPAAVPPEVPSGKAPLVRGFVSGRLPLTDPSQCRPLGAPITMFVSDALGPDAVVEDVATPTSEGECLHAQVLDASADAWARLTYGAICRGPSDTSECGALEARRCEVSVMLNWAEERDSAFTTTDPIFHFSYALSPQDDAARGALFRRAIVEDDTSPHESDYEAACPP